MLSLPQHITWIFILTTLVAFVFFVFAIINSPVQSISKKGTFGALLLLLWLIFQSTLALNGWYMDRKAVPPHVAFPIVTVTIILLLFFILPRGKRFVDGLSVSTLLFMHIIRIPVEICLYWLAGEKQVPWSMTFKGMNFDILFGITAPVIWYIYSYRKLNPKALLAWNVLGLISVLMVVIRGIGAAPTALQVWDFDQPNYAVIHFPFIWLPSFIVPFVIFSHIVVIRRVRAGAKAIAQDVS